MASTDIFDKIIEYIKSEKFDFCLSWLFLHISDKEN